MALISICTPAYNAEQYIHDTAASVIGQTFKDWEWIISDDGSTDRTRAELASISDPRVQVILLPKNRGPAAAYNSSLRAASARYITFIDADDTWDPSFLSEMLAFIRGTGAELAYCGYRRCDELMRPVLRDFRATQDVTFASLLRTNALSTLATVYDTARVGKEYFDYEQRPEDYAMWLKLLRRIPTAKAVDKVLANYRLHPSSRSANKLSLVPRQYNVYRKVLDFGRLRAMGLTACWAWNGLVKYSI